MSCTYWVEVLAHQGTKESEHAFEEASARITVQVSSELDAQRQDPHVVWFISRKCPEQAALQICK
jgi:hypothetical protein